MKYEAELLAEIIANRGHEKSSIHYESECKETFIEECKGGYPKLCDYESEWLNYMVENPIGEFPYETITNVTETTVNNVVPFAFKSAILKGQTLVNVKGEESNDISTDGYSKHDFLIPLAKKNTDYLIKYDTTLSGGILAMGFLKDGKGWSNHLEKQPNIGLIRLNSGEYPNYFRIIAENTQTVSINNLIIIEYQEDMENWDIPYFEGMQSVQMPVLTTTGKNLCPNIFIESNQGRINENSGVIYRDGSLKPSVYVSEYINVKGLDYITYNRQWRISNTGTDGIQSYAFYDENKKFISGSYNITTLTVPNNAHYFRITIDSEQEFQLERGTVATSYEPYKSNILSTPSDLELRGIDEVQDTLDCLTGEVAERIIEIVLDGSDNGITYKTYATNNEGYSVFQCTISSSIYGKRKYGGKWLSTFPIGSPADAGWQNKEYVGGNWYAATSMSNVYVIKLLTSSMSTNDVNGFKEYLQQNPITIQYELETPTVKTVDLTIVNQDGQAVSKLTPFEGTMHMKTDGQPLKPLLTAEVPVEAITQNLASFINEE